MSDKNHRHRHKSHYGKSFIILPIVFFVGTYLVLYLALTPVFSLLFSASGLFFADFEKNYSTEYENIFVPVSENSTIPTIDKNSQTLLDIGSIEYPKYGNQFGEIVIEDCGVDAKLFFGDGDIALRNGVGIYSGSFIPGYGKTILIAGHNNTYFNGLKNAKPGQVVTIRTSYGNYTYEITKTAVKNKSDRKAFDLEADQENLIMYTCYPFDALGLTRDRYFVYAKYVSGTQIDTDIVEGD